MAREGRCRRCGRFRKLKARGLDDSCYVLVLQAGELDQYPTLQRPHVDLEEADRLAQAGYNDVQIALHQGFSSSAVRVARHRKRRSG